MAALAAKHGLGDGLAIRDVTAEPLVALAAFDACLTVAETAWPEEWVQEVRSRRDETPDDPVAGQLSAKSG